MTLPAGFFWIQLVGARRRPFTSLEWTERPIWAVMIQEWWYNPINLNNAEICVNIRPFL
jgi:hypothetical protein